MKRYLVQKKGLLTATFLLGAVTASSSALLAILLQKLIDTVLQGDGNKFFLLAIVAAGYLCFLGIINYCYAYCGKKLLRKVLASIREAVFLGITRRPPSSRGENKVGDDLSAFTNDAALIEQNHLIPLLTVAEYSFMFLCTLGLLLWLSPAITLFLLISMIVMFLVPIILGKALSQRQNAYSARLAHFTAIVKDYLGGLEILRSFHVLHLTQKRFIQENEDVVTKKASADFIVNLNESFSAIVSTLTMVAVVFIGAYQVLVGKISMGTLLALVQLSGTFVVPVTMLMEALPKIKGMRPVVENLNELADTSPEESGKIKPQFHHEITVDQLTFSYDGHRNIIKDLNLTIKRGGKYAIVGPSGCGKTTLIRLLSGEEPHYKGTIRYDGTELKKLDREALRALIAPVHQNVYLFDSTVKDNICLGEPFEEEEIIQALVQSGADGFIQELPQGLNTMVGEGGCRLSGGQCQRIAVARGLIRRRPILILDEGTSSLDRSTAEDIEQRLLAMKDLTMLTITHHLSEQSIEQYHDVIQISPS